MNQALPEPLGAISCSGSSIKTDRALVRSHMLLKELQRCTFFGGRDGAWERGTQISTRVMPELVSRLFLNSKTSPVSGREAAEKRQTDSRRAERRRGTPLCQRRGRDADLYNRIMWHKSKHKLQLE